MSATVTSKAFYTRRMSLGENINIILEKLSKAKLNLAFTLSFSVPIVLLYMFDPDSFESAWKGRLLYSFFIWLLIVELVLGPKKPSEDRLVTYGRKRLFGIFIALVFPTIYVTVINTTFMDTIIQFGRLIGVPSGGIYGKSFLEIHWPLSLEHLVLTASLLTASVLLYGIRGLECHVITSFFLGAIGFFYMYDTFSPFTSAKFLQLFVPSVTASTVFMLNSSGYMAQMVSLSDGSGILVTGDVGRRFAVAINWPCAGIHSLIIYSFVIVLLLRTMTTRFRRKMAYAVVGAVGTFMVNLLRIVSICRAGVNTGYEAANLFHESYGELFFLVWMSVVIMTIFVVETRKSALAANRRQAG